MKKIHMHINIKDALTWSDKSFKNMLYDDDREMTAQECKDFLIEELRKGYDYFSSCDNRKSNGACGGHDIEQSPQIKPGGESPG